MFADVLSAIRRLPGVEAVGAISIRPLGGEGPRTTVHDAGRPTEIVTTPGNPNQIFVAMAGGGVWKTTDGGLTW